jgi:Protein of unknown function (DUF3106)
LRLKTIVALLFVGLMAGALVAQEAPPAQKEPPAATAPERPQEQPGERRGRMGMRGGHHGHGTHAGAWLRKYQNLPPEQQQQALANDPEFQKLPAERQERLREVLRRFNSKTPEERQRILDRMAAFQRLTPEQQERARNLFDRFRSLPEERRHMVRRALRDLREMEPQQRSQVLGSEKFRSMFSADELEVLKGMSELAPPRQENPSDRESAPPPPPDQR